MDDLGRVMNGLLSGRALDAQEAEGVFGSLLSGGLDEAQIGAILALVQTRGPEVDEVVGAARAMRRHVTPVPIGRLSPGEHLIDTCGTGGAPKTFNVSTAAAFVAAAVRPDASSSVARVLVAKHGNRSRTGRGSAEVLAALGVGVDASPEVQAACLRETGVCFCFAIHHHPAMRYAAGPRRSLGFPTIFNVLGPLTNPAGATRQLIGVYRPSYVPLVANALAALGAARAMVVHGLDGLDELTLDGPSLCAEVREGRVTESRIEAQSFGLRHAKAASLEAAGVEQAADMIRSVLRGEAGAARDIVLLNAAAAALVAGACGSLADGVGLAADAVDSGRALGVLTALIERSNMGS